MKFARPAPAAVLCVAMMICGCAEHRHPQIWSNAHGLTDQPWTLTMLNEQPVRPGIKYAYIRLDSETHRYSGSGGCNTISGSYELQPGNRIVFHGGVHTMMACQDSMETEAAFLQILDKADTYTLRGDTLTIGNSETGAVAGFEAHYME